jgi:hypothetical protein
MKKFLFIFLLVCSLAFQATARPKPYLSGIIHLLGGNSSGLRAKLESSPSLNKSWIDGFRVRYGWSDIQPTGPSTYNWDDIQAELDACAAHGKKLSISISAGTTTPDWVFDTAPRVTRFSVDTGGGVRADMPLPFDPHYQAKWATFIAAFGARFDGNPALGAVFFTGRGEQLAEFHITSTPTDETNWNAAAIAAGYIDKSDALRQADVIIIDMFVTAFRTTPTMFTGGNPWGGGPEGVADEDYLDDYVISRPDRLRGLCDSFLHATLTHTNRGNVRSYPFGEQAIFASTDFCRFYSDPPPTGCDDGNGCWLSSCWPPAPIPVYDLLQNGYEKGDQYVEVYQIDVQPDPPNQTVNDSTFRLQRPKLKSNVPNATP